jgi:pyruvate kinase
MRVLINDGAVVLRVVGRKSSEELEVEVVVGGAIGCKKGINTPELAVPVPALTEKDEKDAIIAINQDVDFIALSFVQRASDVMKLRELIAKHLPPVCFSPYSHCHSWPLL